MVRICEIEGKQSWQQLSEPRIGGLVDETLKKDMYCLVLYIDHALDANKLFRHLVLSDSSISTQLKFHLRNSVDFWTRASPVISAQTTTDVNPTTRNVSGDITGWHYDV